MARQSVIFRLPEKARNSIDEDILNDVPFRAIERKHGLKRNTVARYAPHVQRPLREALQPLIDKGAQRLKANLDTVLQLLEGFTHESTQLIVAARESGDGRLQAQALRVGGELAERWMRASGMWPGKDGTAVQVNVGIASITAMPEYPVLIRVLSGHPEIHDELKAALMEAGF